MVICRKFEVVSSFSFGVLCRCKRRSDEQSRFFWHCGTVFSADSWPDSRCAWQKVQGGAEEKYQHHDSLPEEVLKLLKPMAAFQRRVCWMWIIGRLRRVTQNQNQAFNGLIWSPWPKRGVSVSALRWLRCLLTRRQPVLNTTQWSTTLAKKKAT